MTCMSFYPRSATVTAAEDCTVLELLRNVLYMLQRNKKSRAMLEEKYRERAIQSHLRSVPLFGALPLVFEGGTGSELRFPLGVTIVGGLLLSQLLTLYTTPVIYLYMERLKARIVSGRCWSMS